MADVLSRLIVRAEERDLFEGFLMGRNRTRVSHLQFVDDTIFFSKAFLEELQTFKLILFVFGRLLGLRINLNENTLSGINMSQDQTFRMTLMLHCAISVDL